MYFSKVTHLCGCSVYGVFFFEHEKTHTYANRTSNEITIWTTDKVRITYLINSYL